MGDFNGTDLVELIRSGKGGGTPKTPVDDPIEFFKKKLEKVKSDPKGSRAFMDHNLMRADKGLPPLSLKDFQELTGEQ